MAILKPSPGLPIMRGSRHAAIRRSAGAPADAARSPRGARRSARPGLSAGDDEGRDARARRALRRCGRTRHRSRRCRRWRSRSSRRRARSRRRRARAVMAMLATSEPDAGSDSAKAAIACRRASSAARPRAAPSLPNREIGPAPSPCMAKAKSASPSWRASVSRVEAERAHVERRAVVGPARSAPASRRGRAAPPARGRRHRRRR